MIALFEALDNVRESPSCKPAGASGTAMRGLPPGKPRQAAGRNAGRAGLFDMCPFKRRGNPEAY
jgi:hypothetical protein